MEGDIWYATTASSAKSLESLEDNLDDKLMGFIGIDNVGGTIASSITETKIGEVIVAANSVRNRLIIIVGVRFNNVSIDNSASTTLRIRTGTSATATSNTQRKSINLNQYSATTGAAGRGVVRAIIMATVTSTDEVFTGQVYVHVTGTNDTNDVNISSICDFVYVLGI